MDASGCDIKTDIEEYVVGLIDVLGQKEKLKCWGTEQDIENQKPSSLEAVKGTLLVVHRLRKDLEEFIEKYNTPQAIDSETQQKNPDDYQRYLQAANSDIKMFSFSDTVVTYSRVRTEDNSSWRVKSVVGLVIGMAVMQLNYLSRDIPLRGGIDNGLGCDDLLGDFYGPALVSAHHLESKVSQYPRITVGLNTVNFLTRASWAQDDSGMCHANQSMAKYALGFLCSDVFDRKHTIDFAGNQIRVLAKRVDPQNESAWCDMFDKTVVNTKKAIDRSVQDGNQVLACRYKHLLDYLESRQKYWQHP